MVIKSLTALHENEVLGESEKRTDRDSDLRSVKFKMMVENIWKTLNKNYMTGDPNPDCAGRVLLMSDERDKKAGRVWLSYIYDYSRLNSYGKIIVELLSENRLNKYVTYEDKENFLHKYEDLEYKLKEIKEFIEDFEYPSSYCRKNGIKYQFIFWTLMVLTVDDTDKEEHLSLICDFAKMLEVSDEEIMDIVQIIRVIYHKEEAGFKLRSYDVRECFKNLLSQYGYNEVELENEFGSIMSSMLNLAFRR